jgi:hypothetical protein
LQGSQNLRKRLIPIAVEAGAGGMNDRMYVAGYFQGSSIKQARIRDVQFPQTNIAPV